MIPLCDLQQQYLTLQDEIDHAMQQVAASGHYVLGPQVRALEEEVAEFCGCRYAIGVGSGTDALHLSLRALGIGPGDEVITTPFTFVATTEAIGLVGAKPVFVDIDPDTFNIDVLKIEAKITSRTKAIMPVHLYGQPCQMDTIQQLATERGLNVVEDCAQAFGAIYRGQRVGTLGDTGCFSFFPSKNLGCFGDGGMVLTDSRAIYEQVELLRRHGGKVKYHHSTLGLNSRLDELQAAILRVKLKYIEHWNAQRRERAYDYNRLLAGVQAIQRPREQTDQGLQLPLLAPLSGPVSALLSAQSAEQQAAGQSTQSVYHQYTVLVDDRDQRMAMMQAKGIQCFPYYPIPLHLQEVHAGLGYRPGDFPHAESASRHCLSLPMFPELTFEQQQRVVQELSPAVSLAG